MAGAMAVPFQEQGVTNIMKVCELMGVDATLYSGDGSVDSWIQGVETAVNGNYAAIMVFSSVDMELITSQIEYAESKNIPVIDMHYHDLLDAAECPATYCLGAPYKQFGVVEALWAINSAGPDANFLVVSDDTQPPLRRMLEGQDEVFNK